MAVRGWRDLTPRVRHPPCIAAAACSVRSARSSWRRDMRPATSLALASSARARSSARSSACLVPSVQLLRPVYGAALLIIRRSWVRVPAAPPSDQRKRWSEGDVTPAEIPGDSLSCAWPIPCFSEALSSASRWMTSLRVWPVVVARQSSRIWATMAAPWSRGCGAAAAVP